jgi:hypothetical protein
LPTPLKSEDFHPAVCFVIARHPLQSSARANFPKPTFGVEQFPVRPSNGKNRDPFPADSTGPILPGQADRFWLADNSCARIVIVDLKISDIFLV